MVTSYGRYKGEYMSHIKEKFEWELEFRGRVATAHNTTKVSAGLPEWFALLELE